MNTGGENRPKVSRIIWVLWGCWLILVIPCLGVVGPSLTVFDGGDTWKAYMFVASVWTYPIVVGIAMLLRRKAPFLVILPTLNVAAFLMSGGARIVGLV